MEKVDLGERLPIDGIADITALGEALHSIIGYDDVERAIGHAPQLPAYAEAVETITGRRCSELWIHMPIVGALFRLAPK